MEYRTNLLAILEHIDPGMCTYQEWINVGMALKQEGYAASDWEQWSSRDIGRYHTGECTRKWRTFQGNAEPVTGGTIMQIAREQGWMPESGHELEWDDVISWDSDLPIVDHNWIEDEEIHEPANWNPVSQLTQYLSILFDSGENVGYVTSSYKNDKGKYIPQNKGNWDRTAGQLIEALSKCKGDIGAVIGDYNEQGGAWIRFNPLDGKGVRNENVSDFRFALVESDSVDVGRQNAIYRELKLPIAALVFSGSKSLHAIVRIDAADYSEYRKRVDYLYAVCQKNGLKIDTQNRNPSRLSRMPGVTRGGHKQFLVDTNIGFASWSEWVEYIEGISDNLPDPENLSELWGHIPDLSPCLIDNVLRQGHKMLISGPSKAGKSFLLIELCIAIAEGRKWLRWGCAQGKVLYVNLELDRASCLHRFRDVYEAMGYSDIRQLSNIDIWNLRGKSVPMNELAPKLIRRAARKNYIAIVIDPIYKVITGDENSADQMSKFCNEFDLICTELNCAVIYCHHHSKGSQGDKRAADRASGSGVFARDPDALLDLIQLGTDDALIAQEENKAICKACIDYLNRQHYKWQDDLSQDDVLSSRVMLDYCREHLNSWQREGLNKIIGEVSAKAGNLTAWQIEGTLREFPGFEPVNLWFDYPVHRMDDIGSLKDRQYEEDKRSMEKQREKKALKDRLKKEVQFNEFEIAFSDLEQDGEPITYAALAEKLELSVDTISRWFGKGKKQREDIKKHFEIYKSDENNMTYIRRSDGRTD